ncbi:MAG: DUF4810 domain-containing protein [Desulforhopalus sp.]
MYYFGNYSETLYSFEKNQNEETLLNHKQELERIIAESDTRKLPVPPGIYAELGYLNLKANNSEKSIQLFQAEEQLYPESSFLMGRLIQSAKAQDTAESEASGQPVSRTPVAN